MRVCGKQGCPVLTNTAYCTEHTTKPWAGSDRRQRLPRNWARIRRVILHRNPTCQNCMANPSTEVDHIVPGDDHQFPNLQALCHDCHRRKTLREAAEARTQ